MEENVDKITEDLKHSSILSSAQLSPDIVFDDHTNKALLSKWPRLRKGVPDILLHKTVDFAQHVKEILRLDIKIYQPYLGTNYTKIPCCTIKDYKAVRQYFVKNHMPYHTFAVPNKKIFKVAIRGLSRDIKLNELFEVLKSAKIPVKRVHKMKVKQFASDQEPIVLIVLAYNDEGLKLLRVKKIFGHEVTVEPPIQKTRQCYRCQKWGHAQRFCHGVIKCVKCAGDHYSKACSRDRNCSEPPTCANCGGNHTANYRQCFYCPDSEEYKQNRLKKLKNKTEPQKFPRQLVTWEDVHNNLYKRVTNIPNHAEAIPF